MYPNYSTNNFYKRMPNKMKLTGTGLVNAKPDTAVITLGVVTENKSLQDAINENAAKSNAVINTLLQMNVPKKSITTNTYNVEPQYDYVEGKQIFRNYKVSNIISVTTKDLNNLGSIIDNSTASGANYIQGVTFQIENVSEYYNKALNLAINDSIQKAYEISLNLRIALCKIPYAIIEQNSTNYLEDTRMVKYASNTTPILPKELTITAKVESSFYYYN